VGQAVDADLGRRAPAVGDGLTPELVLLGTRAATAGRIDVELAQVRVAYDQTREIVADPEALSACVGESLGELILQSCRDVEAVFDIVLLAHDVGHRFRV
jgi:hypothetical protein